MSTNGARMGLGSRLCNSWRRLYLRWTRDPRKKPGRTGGRVKAGTFFRRIILIIAGTGGVGFISFVVYVTHQQDRDSQQFITSFEDMFEQGEAKMDGGSGGSFHQPKGVSKHRRYDSKARAFVDPKMWSRWGREAEKGRAKRHLFTAVHRMSKEKGRPQLTLQELMALPSSFDASGGVSDTTIILNQWKRTTLEEQLDAILEQSVRPAGGVWVCLFNSPREVAYRRVVEAYKSKFEEYGGLFFVSSSFNFKYYGRFQMALQARTRYVWIVDDDVMPGSKFLHQLSHIAGIPEAEGADGSIGPMALGSVGWIMPGVKESNGEFYSYRYYTEKGGLFLPDKRYGIPVPHLQEVDLLCSHWFLETDWVRLLFREKWETPETGEDYMLAYSLRKHAGVRSYVVPMDLSDSETWGNTDVEWDMQNQGGGATTLRSTVPMRDRLWHRLLNRGGEYFMSPRYAERPSPLVLVVDGAADAEVLRPLFEELQASYSPARGRPTLPDSKGVSRASKQQPPLQRPPRVVLTGRGITAIGCSKAAEILGNAEPGQGRESTLCNSDSFASAWDLMAGRHFPREGLGRAGGSGGRDHVLMADLAAGLAGVAETLKPLAIVSVAGSGPSAGVGGAGGGGAALDEALGAVTEQSGVPLIRLPRRKGASGSARWLSRLAPRAFSAWHRARVDILVLYDPGTEGGSGIGDQHTEAQLQKLLGSLAKADYLGDRVDITIAISSGSVPDDVTGESFSWPHGRKVVRGSIRARDSGEADGGGSPGDGIAHAALGTLALRSWMPQDDDRFVVVLEANHVVSRLFYSWLKAAVLETAYGPGRQASAPPKKGVCVPGGGGSSAWLFPPDHWREAQALCLGGGAGGAKRCDVEGYLKPPESSWCPSLRTPSETLVARTGPDGLVVDDTSRVLDDDDTLAELVRSTLFPSKA